MIGFKSVLVTGSTGFIGLALTRRLVDEGVKVYSLIRSSSANLARLKAISGVEIIEVQSFNLSDIHEALTDISAEVIFNLASCGVNQSDRDPEAILEGNVNLVARVLLATSQWPLKMFIHAGSCFEYGLSPASEPISENQRVEPISLYGAAKAASVIYGKALARELSTPFITLRLFGVFGIGEAPGRLVPYLIEMLDANRFVDLTPGEQVRDMLYIDDVVEAFLVAAQCGELSQHDVYNVCSGQPVSIREIAETVANVMNKPQSLLRFGERPYREDEAMWIVGSSSRFVSATNWQPRVGLREGIQHMVEVALSN